MKYLYKLLGTTDISSIGNGSVTGALSTLNTYIGWKGPSNITSLATLTAYFDNLVTSGVRTGYLSAAQSSAVGLPNNGFYWQILSQSQNYAVVLFWAIGGDKLYTLYKGNGTWASTFTLLPYRSEVDKLNTDNVGLRQRISTGASYDAIKIKSSAESSEQRIFFYGIGANSKTIIFNLYFRGSNNTVIVENLGELVVKATRDPSATDTVIVTMGTYASGLLLSFQDVVTISYSTTSETIVSHSITSIGDGSITGAIARLYTDLITNLGTRIPPNASFNNYMTPGIYYSADLSTVTDFPVNDSTASCELYVVPRASTARVIQIAVVYYGNHATQKTWIYTRAMNGENTFSSWVAH